MSGGSYNYAYYRIEELAGQIQDAAKTAERKAFVKLLFKVAAAAKAIEWVDSGDYAPGDEIEYIEEAIGCQHKELCMLELVEEAEHLVKELQKHITNTKHL